MQPDLTLGSVQRLPGCALDHLPVHAVPTQQDKLLFHIVLSLNRNFDNCEISGAIEGNARECDDLTNAGMSCIEHSPDPGPACRETAVLESPAFVFHVFALSHSKERRADTSHPLRIERFPLKCSLDKTLGKCTIYKAARKFPQDYSNFTVWTAMRFSFC